MKNFMYEIAKTSHKYINIFDIKNGRIGWN